MSVEVKEKTLTAMQLALYGQAEVSIANGNRGEIVSVDFLRNEAFIEHDENTEWFSLSALKPILRPMTDLTSDEILKVCELAAHAPFLTKKRWEVNRERDDVIYISSKRSEYSFAIYTHKNTGYGDVTITRHHEDIEPETEQTSNIGLITQFYLERGLDCFGWIDSGIAINKTKI